jgi:hypothetical protein
VCERVSASVQPVHSWKESQITEGRRALLQCRGELFRCPGRQRHHGRQAAAEFQELTATDTAQAQFGADAGVFSITDLLPGAHDLLH